MGDIHQQAFIFIYHRKKFTKSNFVLAAALQEHEIQR
jgi:hypothetical protein